MKFSRMPQEYEAMKNSIKNEILQKLYSKFSYSYFLCSFNRNQNVDLEIENTIFNYLQNFKFFTYYISDNKNDIVTCSEGECLIIEQIDISIIQRIIQKLKNQTCTQMINAKSNCTIIEKTKEEKESEIEINNFCKNFSNDKKNNKFINLTINPVVCYLIRRYFYPTVFFNDQSFFNFQISKSKEQEIKKNMNNYLLMNHENKESEIEKLKINILTKIEDNDDVYIQDFKESDFIILRNISVNQIAIYNLVIHLDTLFIFFMKRMSSPVDEEKSHEVNFCKNYKNRCMTQFYGFLKENTKIIGFIYEFMSNGQLDSYLSNKQVSNAFLLMTMNRIFQGIEYLHLNSLIHRDIKPSNIFLNHDFLSFFSDFETLRHPNYDVEDMTINIGSFYYSSPEQEKDLLLSYSSDIYSFGLVLFYLFEKKHFRSQSYKNISLNNVLPGIQYIFNLCINFESSNRPNCQEIKSILIEKVNPFEYLFDYLMNKKEQIETYIICQYIVEYIYILYGNEERLNKFFDILLNFKYILNFKINEDESVFLNALGKFYQNGYGVKQDYQKAIKYYEMSAQKNNSESLLLLGSLYLKGEGVDQDLAKAKKYFEHSAKMKNSDSIYYLGVMYENGIEVKKNYLKAKYYYELSAQQNNSNALYNLGKLYLYGNGVSKNITKAIELFELSSKLNNADSQWILGYIYSHENFVEKDYQKAKEYFELAAKQNQIDALYDLGVLYLNGYGVEKNYSKAFKCLELSADLGNTNSLISLGNYYESHGDYLIAKRFYEIAAEQDDSDAYLFLGNLYLKGHGVDVDYNKAKEYFELSAKQVNSEAYLYLGYIYDKGYGVIKSYKEAIKYYELAANCNNSAALFILGSYYLNGIGVEKNYLIAKEYFEKSANLNDSDSMILLGKIYRKGLGVKKDYLKARQYYESAALLDNKEAFLQLSKIYEKGLGVEENQLKSLAYLNLYNNQDNKDAYGILGDIYYYGEGVKQSFSAAIKYYELAAKDGNDDALFSLGSMYNDGKGVKKDFLKAKYYYELAAKGNNSNALNNLGVLFENGNGVEKSYSKAIEYYELAAKLNNSDALSNLGLLYENGYGVTVDYMKAKHYYLLSSQLNNSEGLLNLGNLYKNGHGVKQNYSEAQKYYKLAAELGNSEALLNLGILYEKGYGVKQNYLKAKEFYLESSKLQNSSASFNLGIFYFNGLGVDQDYKKSKEYFELSAQNDNFEAFFYLGYFYSVGDPFILNISKAIQYYLKCTEFHSGMLATNHSFDDGPSYDYKFNRYVYPSFNELGLIYLTVLNDMKKAFEYIKESGLNEFPFGQNNYGLMLQLYQNKISDAEYMFLKSSKKNFALAEYNLGYLYELNGNITKSIEYYIKASNDEFEPLFFNNIEFNDKRLEMSKIFIISYVNLKLIEFYFIKENFEESKEYFIKLISELEINTDDLEYYFQFRFANEAFQISFSYLREFIFKCPYFNILNQPNLIDEIKYIITKTNEEKNFVIKNKNDQPLENSNLKISNNFSKEEDNTKNLNSTKIDTQKDDEILQNDQSFFEDPADLFDYVINENKLKNIFISEITDIIGIMKKQLYKPPYNILFGRLNLGKLMTNENSSHKQNINKSFYDGFDL